MMFVFAMLFTLVTSAFAGDDARELPEALPAVDALLTQASDKAEMFAQQAVVMQKKVEMKQTESAERLAKQRESYAQVLQDKMLNNRMVAAFNKRIRKEILSLKERVEEAKLAAKQTETGNAVMRAALATLEKNFIVANEFIGSSFNETDDRQAAALDILRPLPAKPTLRYFLTVASRRFGPGLLQLSPALVLGEDKDPQDWLQMLKDSLENIEEAEREGEVALRTEFYDALEKVNETHVKLTQEQMELNETKRNLEVMEVRIGHADTVLQNSSEFLLQRFDSIKFFTDRFVEDLDDIVHQADLIVDEDSGFSPPARPANASGAGNMSALPGNSTSNASESLQRKFVEIPKPPRAGNKTAPAARPQMPKVSAAAPPKAPKSSAGAKPQAPKESAGAKPQMPKVTSQPPKAGAKAQPHPQPPKMAAKAQPHAPKAKAIVRPVVKKVNASAAAASVAAKVPGTMLRAPAANLSLLGVAGSVQSSPAAPGGKEPSAWWPFYWD